MVGAPVEDTISIMQLITHGIPARYPDIKIINSHLGGALPMLLQRADDQYRWEAPDTPERPSVAARRMWYDTVGHGHVPALRCAIDSFGADRLLLGTDFPYENGDTFVRAVDYINDPQIDTERRPGHPRPERQRPARHRTGTPGNRQLLGEDEVISLVIPPVLGGDRSVYRPGQARGLHWAGPADPLSLVDLAQRGPIVPTGKKRPASMSQQGRPARDAGNSLR